MSNELRNLIDGKTFSIKGESRHRMPPRIGQPLYDLEIRLNALCHGARLAEQRQSYLAHVVFGESLPFRSGLRSYAAGQRTDFT